MTIITPAITIIVPSETPKHAWMLTMLDGSLIIIVMIVPLVMPLLLLL